MSNAEQIADSRLVIRMPPSLKQAVEDAARRDLMTASPWLRQIIRQALRKKEKEVA